MHDDISPAGHLRWAKGRALDYIDRGQLMQAVQSILSDLQEHSELRTQGRESVALCKTAFDAWSAGADALRLWIEGLT